MTSFLENPLEQAILEELIGRPASDDGQQIFSWQWIKDGDYQLHISSSHHDWLRKYELDPNHWHAWGWKMPVAPHWCELASPDAFHGSFAELTEALQKPEIRLAWGIPPQKKRDSV